MAWGFPCGRRATDPVLGWQPLVQALFGHDGELDFRHIEPAAMRGGIANIQLPQQATGFSRRKGVVQGSRRRRMQVVQDDADQSRLWEMHVSQLLPTVREVLRGPPVGDLDVPPALQGLQQHAQMTRAFPALLIVIPEQVTRPHRQGLAHLTDQLVWTLIHTDHRRPRVIGLSV